MLHEKLKQIREKAGLTQTEFAKTLSIGSSTYNSYETNKQVPRTDFIERVCNVYQVSADWLLNISPVQKLSSGTYSDLIHLLNLLTSNYQTKRFACSYKEIFYDYSEQNQLYHPEQKTVKDASYFTMIIDDETTVKTLMQIADMQELLEKETLDQDTFDTWLKGKLISLSTKFDYVPNLTEDEKKYIENEISSIKLEQNNNPDPFDL